MIKKLAALGVIGGGVATLLDKYYNVFGVNDQNLWWWQRVHWPWQSTPTIRPVKSFKGGSPLPQVYEELAPQYRQPHNPHNPGNPEVPIAPGVRYSLGAKGKLLSRNELYKTVKRQPIPREDRLKYKQTAFATKTPIRTFVGNQDRDF